MRPLLGGKRVAAPHSCQGLRGNKMAACGYLLLLTLILGNLPLELARLPERRVLQEEDNKRQPSQASMVERRNEHPPRLHGGHPKKVLPFPEAEQQKYIPVQLRRRRHGTRILYPVGGDEVIVGEDALVGHKEYYLPRPPSRMHPHVYEDPVHHGEEKIIRDGTREVIIPESSFGVTPHIYQDLQQEKMKQANKHHNNGHEHEHEHEREHEHKHRPSIQHNNYWVIGQRRFRMIIIIILAVIVGFIIVLILAWFFCPRKFIKKM
ncbi:uncharacterized protein [Heptranchias perlo]|uniref:uncharacterized protein n=1 Tax=Heptranchias perlo TaxID=212740 RepID=UPI003559FA70